MNRQRPMIVALALIAAAAGASAAQAHGRPEAQWSVTIGAPVVVLPRIVLPVPPLPQVRVQPVVVAPPTTAVWPTVMSLGVQFKVSW